MNLTAKSAIVCSARDNSICFGKNTHMPLPNASTTKLLTALVALEDSCLEGNVQISARTMAVPFTHLREMHSPSQFTVIDLLYVMLMESDNGASLAFAEHVATSPHAFMRKMNERAADFGCRNTLLKNPHGLPQRAHYSSASDLALIARQAIDSRTIMGIVGKSKHCLFPRGLGQRLCIHNTNPLLAIDGFSGMKTGYSRESGYCLVGAYRKPKHHTPLITVVLGCPTRESSVRDTLSLVEEAHRFKSRGLARARV